jgi:hypothetical protein
MMTKPTASAFPVSDNVSEMKASSTLAAMQAADAMPVSRISIRRKTSKTPRTQPFAPVRPSTRPPPAFASYNKRSSVSINENLGRPMNVTK